MIEELCNNSNAMEGGHSRESPKQYTISSCFEANCEGENRKDRAPPGKNLILRSTWQAAKTTKNGIFPTFDMANQFQEYSNRRKAMDSDLAVTVAFMVVFVRVSIRQSEVLMVGHMCGPVKLHSLEHIKGGK